MTKLFNSDAVIENLGPGKIFQTTFLASIHHYVEVAGTGHGEKMVNLSPN